VVLHLPGLRYERQDKAHAEEFVELGVGILQAPMAPHRFEQLRSKTRPVHISNAEMHACPNTAADPRAFHKLALRSPCIDVAVMAQMQSQSDMVSLALVKEAQKRGHNACLYSV
jgi:hypothetical protein